MAGWSHDRDRSVSSGPLLDAFEHVQAELARLNADERFTPAGRKRLSRLQTYIDRVVDGHLARMRDAEATK